MLGSILSSYTVKNCLLLLAIVLSEPQGSIYVSRVVNISNLRVSATLEL